MEAGCFEIDISDNRLRRLQHDKRLENILSIEIKISSKVQVYFSDFERAAWINLLFLGGYYGTRTRRTTTEIGVLLLNWQDLVVISKSRRISTVIARISLTFPSSDSTFPIMETSKTTSIPLLVILPNYQVSQLTCNYSLPYWTYQHLPRDFQET